MRYVTESDLVKEVQRSIAIATREGRPVDPVAMARLVKLQKQKAVEAGALLTAQQGRDRAVGRALQVGDRARYIGPTRIEDSRLGPRERPHGQIGTIIEHHGRTLKFMPDGEDAVALILPNSVPAVHALERVPEESL